MKRYAVLLKKALILLRREGPAGFWRRAAYHGRVPHRNRYRAWLEKNSLSEEEMETIKGNIDGLDYSPLLSVIVPVYNVGERWLRKCLDSVVNQLYQNWELCVADDASTVPHVKKVLEEYRSSDSRIKVVYRETNGHIAAASNSALAVATGEFIALLDHDDELTPDALYEMVKLLNRHPDADMIYSDQDKINAEGLRHTPLFKPGWSPDTLFSQMYTCHLGVYRAALVRELGGFREGFEGSQDYDLVLRLTEKTGRIYHIPKVLYSWRETSSSTAFDPGSKSYAYGAGMRALNEHLSRKYGSGKAWGEPTKWDFYDVRFRLPDKIKVSIIIPTKDRVELLRDCLDSITGNTNITC